MNIRNLALAAAVGSLLGMSMTTASAADDKADKDKCYGVAQAGKNDCATSKNQCHGHVNVDRDSEAWIYVPKGTCAKIAGARISNANDPTPGVKQ